MIAVRDTLIASVIVSLLISTFAAFLCRGEEHESRWAIFVDTLSLMAIFSCAVTLVVAIIGW